MSPCAAGTARVGGHWTKRHEWAFSEDREGSDPDACLRLLAVALAKPEQVATWVQKESVY